MVTDARPAEIKSLFRNCRLIGRRFRLAHIYFGRHIIEVATFRGSDPSGDRLIQNGRLLRDNVYGTLQEDVWRRDFTVNALYYSAHDYSVVDYVGGMKDHACAVLRLIGDPERRYREDPVRILRAIRFAAKLGFEIEANSNTPIFELAPLLSDIPPARLFDETLKLFMTGHAERVFELLVHYQTFEELFPESARYLGGESAMRFLTQALVNTDLRLSQDKRVTPGFLLAAFLWPPLRQICKEYQVQGLSEFEAMDAAASEVVRLQCERVAFPRRFSLMAKDIWTMQPHLEQRKSRRVKQILERQRFRAAYDFLLLRFQAGESALKERVNYWTNIQQTPENKSDKSGGDRQAHRRSRRGRRHRRSAPV